MDNRQTEKRKELPPKLANPTSYREWRVQMKLHFKRHGVWRLVEGLEEKPTETEEIAKFERREAGAHCDLLLCLAGDLKKLALAHDTLSDTWLALENACNLADEVELHRVEEEIERFSGAGSVLMSTTKLQSLFSRLVAAGGAISETQKTLKLLKILPKSYDEFALNIKTNKVFRNHDNTYNFEKIVRKVQQRAMVTEPVKTSGTPTMRSGKVMKLRCHNCQEEGHTKWKCKRCFHCKGLGHRARECPRKQMIHKQK